MAAKDLLPKLSKESANELVDGIRQLKTAGQLENLAEQAGVSPGLLGEIADKGTKALKKVGEGLNALQEGVNALRGQTDLEKLGAKAAQGGEVPPTVPSAFKTESLGKERGYTVQPPIGGPLAPAPQSRALQKTQEKLNFYPSEAVDAATGAPMSKETAVVPFGQTIERPTATQAEVAGAAAQAKPGAPGAGVSELTPEAMTPRAAGYRTEAERAADLGLSMDMSLAPEARTAAKFGLGIGAGAAAGYGIGLGITKLIEEKPFASNPAAQEAAPTLVSTGVDTPKKVTDVVDNAVKSGGLTTDQGEQVKTQVKTLEDLFTQAQKELKDELKRDKARIEFYQLLDKVVDGVASMIGANALMNKNLPYAVDFSKGPQIDWNARLAQVQEEYKTGLNALTTKYKIQESKQAEQARLAARQAEKEEDRAFRREMQRERLAAQAGTKEAEAAEKTAAATEKTDAKLAASIQAVLDETASPGRILTEKKNLITLGIQKLGQPTVDALVEQASEAVEGGRGLFRQAEVGAKSLIGMDTALNPKEQQAVTKKFAELLGEKLAQPAGGLVDMVAPDGRALRVPAERVADLEAKGARRK